MNPEQLINLLNQIPAETLLSVLGKVGNGNMLLRPTTKFDTAIWSVGEAFASKDLFVQANQGRSPHITNGTFPIAGKVHYISSLVCDARLNFAAYDSAAAADILDFALNYTLVQITLGTTLIYEVPLVDCVNISQSLVGTTWATVEKEGFIAHQLPEMIVVPANAPLKVAIATPQGSGLTMAATATANPHIIGAPVAAANGVTAENRGFSVRTRLRAVEVSTPIGVS